MCSSMNVENAADKQRTAITGGPVLAGKFSRHVLVRWDLLDGTTITGPEEIFLKRDAIKSFGEIIDIACKITSWCGGDEGGGGGGGGGPRVCYEVTISTNGEIKLTPVSCPPQMQIV